MSELFIKRGILEDLRRDLGKREISFLIGPRQSGKTTLMKVLQEELQKKGEKTLFLSLDFEYDKEYFLSQQNLIKKIELELGREKGVVFIDEIQRKENAGLFLKGIHDLGLPYKFIVSGSGSVDLKAKIKESMVGRKRVYELYPVSLVEFVNFKTDYRYKGNLLDFFSSEKTKLNHLLSEYLNFGGYPRIILEPELRDKIRTIDEIYQGYMEKDITYLLRVEKIEAFSSLIKLLADRVGKLINFSEISNTLGISLPTLKNYLWYAEKTFILQRVTPYFRNVRNEISKSPTVYFNDTGLRNYSLGIFGRLLRQDDFGFVFQNLVFLVLIEKIRWSNAEIHYWRSKSGSEIDFVIDLGKKSLPIEVKYREFSQPIIPRSFHGFIEKYQPERCMVVNKNLKTTIKLKGSEVLFLTVWDLIQEDILRF
ncbi:MAG: ATP-binding protein [Thermodesulfobacteriota bacterium]|jgi:predicted AAA+ superfamily ATPase